MGLGEGPDGAVDSRYPFLSGGGDAALLIAAFDWSRTPVGCLDAWPQSLKTAAGLLLRSPVPIVLLWGEDGIMIYNDAYSIFAGGRHPAIFGSKVREGWPEVADFNDNIMKVGLAGGTLAYKDQELTLYRHRGEPEQVWMNLDYSPVLGEDGRPAGVIAIVVETTAKVKAEERSKTEGERLRQMFEQAPGFVATLTGPDHVFEIANNAYLQPITGTFWENRSARHYQRLSNRVLSICSTACCQPAGLMSARARASSCDAGMTRRRRSAISISSISLSSATTARRPASSCRGMT